MIAVHSIKLIFSFTIILCTYTTVTCEQYQCQKIKEIYSPRVQQINIPKASQPNSEIILYWGDELSHAAVALFKTIVHDAIGYQRVTLRKGPNNLNQLIAIQQLKPQVNKRTLYKEIALVLSTAWEPTSSAQVWPVKNERINWNLAGPRLEEFGSSAIQTRLQLHVYLPESYQLNATCANVTDWRWYADIAALQHCGFDATSDDNVVTVYGVNPGDTREFSGILSINDEIHLPRFRFQKLHDRKSLLEILHSANRSFLFMDYDMWLNYPNVYTIYLPFCVSNKNTTCLLEADARTALRIADVSLLKDYAPRLLQLAYDFSPLAEVLREILILQCNKTDEDRSQKYDPFEWAACEWASKHYEEIDLWVQKYNEQTYEMAVFHCAGDLDFKEYDKLLDMLSAEVDKMTRNTNISIQLKKFDANCSDPNYLIDNLLLRYMSSELIERFMGAVIGKMEEVKNIVELAGSVPIVLYDTEPIDSVSTWHTTRDSLPVAIAIHHFILNMSWTRVAVISEDTAMAMEFVNLLDNSHGITYLNFEVPHNITAHNTENVLKEIEGAKACVVLVNTGAENAINILSVAERFGMNASANYVWIIRERLRNTSLNIKHFTISPYCQNGKDVPNTNGRLDLRQKMDNVLWPNRHWPAQAIPLTDAVLTLVNSFISIILKNPQLRDDIHNRKFVGLMETSLTEEPVQGIIQNLIYKGHTLEEIPIFIEEWPDHEHKYKALWRVNKTARSVYFDQERRTAYFDSSGATMVLPSCGSPHYGTGIGESSDSYLQPIWATILVLLLLVPIVIALIRRILRYRYRLHKYSNKPLSPHLNQKIAAYLVKLSALEMENEADNNDTSQFSNGHLAKLHIGGQTITVAIKRECGHKIDFGLLREASVLTSLKNNNIIRLVGVCFDNESPMTLIEVAFFGDLLQYLKSRRYLVEEAASLVIGEICREAAYISTKALTELARQAASALAYLSTRGVVHRDLRASNCLIDSNRCLKLSGFCMATEPNDGDDTEIPCMQRELSVQGMSPESILGGFSTASDVWAFGVLVVEIVTMGDKPYGNMLPSQVKKLIAEGGTPQLPPKASPLTNELVKKCWRRELKQRATAVEIEEYLTREPTALSPALFMTEDTK